MEVHLQKDRAYINGKRIKDELDILLCKVAVNGEANITVPHGSEIACAIQGLCRPFTQALTLRHNNFCDIEITGDLYKFENSTATFYLKRLDVLSEGSNYSWTMADYHSLDKMWWQWQTLESNLKELALRRGSVCCEFYINSTLKHELEEIANYFPKSDDIVMPVLLLQDSKRYYISTVNFDKYTTQVAISLLGKDKYSELQCRDIQYKMDLTTRKVTTT